MLFGRIMKLTRMLGCVAVLCACGGEKTATYQVTWSLVDMSSTSAPSCASYKIADVVVSTTDTETGDTTTISAPCDAGKVDTAKIELGSHRLKVEAMGMFGEVVGSKETNGMLTTADQQVMLASVAIPVIRPTTKSQAKWTIRKAGANSSCSAVTNNGVRTTTAPMSGTPIIDLWDCTELDTAIDVPYGPWNVTAEILGANNLPLGTSMQIHVDASRGTTPVMLTIDVP